MIEDATCRVMLSGQIENDDAKRLEQVLGKAWSRFEYVDVCLNSPGGSYSEALQIIEQMLNSRGFGTVVKAQHQCMSACAIIFMFGHYTYPRRDDRDFRRFLDVRGKLGFHAPYIQAVLPMENSMINFRAYRAGVRAVGRLLELDDSAFLSRTLISAFLKTDPDDFLTVDTIGQAGEWTITLINHELPIEFNKLANLTDPQLRQACDNYDRWQRERDVLKGGEVYLSGFSVAYTVVGSRAIFAQESDQYGHCVALLKQDPESRNIAMQLIFERSRATVQKLRDTMDFDLVLPRPIREGFREEAPLWFFLKPETRLETLAK